jgi:hypothetical protein
VTALLVMMVLAAIGTMVTVVGVNNLQNASRDRAAESSLGAGDAGVAQAIEYLRNNGVGGLKCMESNQAACASYPAGYNNPTSPKLIPLDSAGVGCNAGNNNCAKVWIGIVQQYSPPAVKLGTYNIHSEGMYGVGPSARNIVVTVKVAPDKFPIGVFGETLSGNGGTNLYTESLFTRDCVYPIYTGSGNGTRFTGIDNYWGQPAAAHTTSHISSSNSCGSNGYIASSAPSGSASANHCPNSTDQNLNGMQSGDGGLVSSAAGSACYHIYQRSDGSWYPDGSCPSGVTTTRTDGLCDTTAFTTADLQRYGYRPRGLTDAQYSALKARAQGTGTYNIAVGNVGAAIASAVASGINDPVLYWDCSVANPGCVSGGVSLSYSNFPANAFQTAPSTNGTCVSPYQIVTIVVEHGDLTFQGGNSTWFDAAMFVPDGSFNGNGGYNINGTLFSNNLSMGGNQGWDLDSCWVTNFPGAIISVQQVGFREDDAKNAG